MANYEKDEDILLRTVFAKTVRAIKAMLDDVRPGPYFVRITFNLSSSPIEEVIASATKWAVLQYRRRTLREALSPYHMAAYSQEIELLLKEEAPEAEQPEKATSAPELY